MSTRLALLVSLAFALFLGCRSSGSGQPIAPASGAVPTANAAGHGRQKICTPGVQCLESCPEGGCNLICQGGASCNQTCAGGNCAQTCEIAASCNFSCSGGYCLQRCIGANSCRTSCTGGGCTLETGDEREAPAEEAPPPGQAQ